MALTQGRAAITIALIDGPVNTALPHFEGATIADISSNGDGRCSQLRNFACEHGTLVAALLVGRHEPAICPACTLLLRPIFGETSSGSDQVPSASPEVLAEAIAGAVTAGSRIINLSCGLTHGSGRGDMRLRSALNFAASRGVVVIAAAGNQGRLGSSCVTNHPWVIPVVAIDRYARPTSESNLSATVGLRGLAAPGQDLPSVHANGTAARFSGTSAACPVVTGAAALLWSEFPHCTGHEIKAALTGGPRRRSIAPPAMNAWAAYQRLNTRTYGRKTA